jgi:hypothetical protein
MSLTVWDADAIRANAGIAPARRTRRARPLLGGSGGLGDLRALRGALLTWCASRGHLANARLLLIPTKKGLLDFKYLDLHVALNNIPRAAISPPRQKGLVIHRRRLALE